MRTTNLILLLILFGNRNSVCAQSTAPYLQSNKEVEYNYGAVAPESFNHLTDIEKIKYQLRYEERTVTKQITEGNSLQMEIIIDSTNTEEPWMKLSNRFRYTDQGIELFGKDGQLSQQVPYTEEQVNERQEIRQDIAENGFHPGMASFPEFTSEVRNALIANGTGVVDVSPAVVKLVFSPNQSTTFDSKFFTITEEWVDDEGLKNTELRAYEPYESDKGFLLRMLKHERIRYSENGPCITEIKLKYYSDYIIRDNGHFIEKATDQFVSVEIYPNPNTGVFQVFVRGPQTMTIQRTEIINIVSGQVETVNLENLRSFVVNKPNLSSGNYTLRVTTNSTTLNSSFFKQ
jgi:hypothetical protein